MKKENRIMAQQRRAEERRKKRFRKKMSKFLVISIPTLAALILVGIIIADAVKNKDTSDQTADTNTESLSDNNASGYSTDSSLTVENGDTVNIDYVGSVDGVEFDGGNTQGMGTDLVIGSGSYIDDFEEQLIGAHPGDVVEVNVTFPDPYENNTDLSGKEALFTVTVNGIYQ